MNKFVIRTETLLGLLRPVADTMGVLFKKKIVKVMNLK